MAFLYVVFFLVALILIFKLSFSPFSNKNGLPRNWPIIGMLPAILANLSNIFNWFTVVFNESGQSTFSIKGPWFMNLNLLLTIDPANVRYTSSTRFSNFPRGPKSREMFDLFGDSIFNLDGEEWLVHRKIIRSFFSDKRFNECSTKMAFEKVENGIVVVLDNVAAGGHLGNGDCGVVDLQDLFSRYTYDLTYRLVVGNDPMTLSLQWDEVPFTKAMNNAMQSVWMRHLLPAPFWKFQRLLDIGHEKILKKAKRILNEFSTKIVSNRHDKFNLVGLGDDKFTDIYTTYVTEDEHYRSGDGDQVLKEGLLSILLAGKDTTSAAMTWFFWMISQHPSIEAKIKIEIARVISKDNKEKTHVFTHEEISKFVYLHATICETLRLYPPVPFQSRAPLERDILPSGHEVNPNSTMVIIPLYSMARMKTIWGNDCAEFKPERWIAKNGELKHEPSHKFFTFNSGPRICVGKDVSFIQMKTAIATILYNYNVHVLENQNVVPASSVILQTRYGVHARITKRWI